jgi:hypothetical protein
VLTPAQMRQVTLQWQPQFHAPENFEKSVARFLELVGDPSAEKLHNWLAKDQAKDELLHTAVPREPLVPSPSTYQPNDCPHCAGNTFIRVEVPITDPRFGKALPCPACSGGRRSELVGSSEPVEVRSGYWCWKCGRDQGVEAGETCKNPIWHTPNANSTPAEQPTIDTVLRKF